MLDINKSIENLLEDVVIKDTSILTSFDEDDLVDIICSILEDDDWQVISKSNNITNEPPEKQQASELDNQATPVNAVEDIKRRNYVTNNKEAFFEKAIFYDSVFDLIDNDYISKSGIIEGEQPIGAKTLGNKIEYELYSSLRNSINDWYSNVSQKSDINNSIIDLKKNMIEWTKDASWAQIDNMYSLFEKGIKVGENLSGIQADYTAFNNVNSQIFKKSGIVNAIERFSDDVYRNVSGILQKHYKEGSGIPLYRTKRDIDSYLRKSRARTELMLKTETAKFANHGLLKAFDLDNEKHLYNYYWLSKSDDRTKKISEIRKGGNPYSYNEIAFLWNHQEQYLDGYWQADQYNQRCSIARGERLDNEFTDNRFFGKEALFRET